LVAAGQNQYIWSASIGKTNVDMTHWSTELSYVCQYHSK